MLDILTVTEIDSLYKEFGWTLEDIEDSEVCVYADAEEFLRVELEEPDIFSTVDTLISLGRINADRIVAMYDSPGKYWTVNEYLASKLVEDGVAFIVREDGTVITVKL